MQIIKNGVENVYTKSNDLHLGEHEVGLSDEVYLFPKPEADGIIMINSNFCTSTPCVLTRYF